AEEVEQPSGPGQDLREERDEVREAPGDQLGRAVAHVALAHAGDRRVDGDDQGRVAAGLGALYGLDANVATAAQVQLVPGRAAGGLPDLFKARSGKRGERVDRS